MGALPALIEFNHVPGSQRQAEAIELLARRLEEEASSNGCSGRADGSSRILG